MASDRVSELRRSSETGSEATASLDVQVQGDGDRDGQAAHALVSEADRLEIERLRQNPEQEISRLQGELSKVRAVSDGLAQTSRRLQTRLNQQSELLLYYKETLELREQEIRYRLGDVLVRAADSPVDLLLLPWRVAKLFLTGSRKRRERHKRQKSEAREKGRPIQRQSACNTTGTKGGLRGLKPAARRPDRPPRLPLGAAVILDEFSQECFKGECRLIQITPKNWMGVLSADRPDLLLVESAWHGNGGTWRGEISRARYDTDSPLAALVNWCRSRDIPTVFWNKEDPPNFEHFISAATLFDHIFTTDENCIPLYRQRVKHDRVYVLPFGVQPDIHNPVGSRDHKIADFCFAGTYYAARHGERRSDLDILLRPAIKRGLHIFDRMHGLNDERHRFPPEYQPAIQGSLSYPDMIDAYKKYRVFLNVNSVNDSPTMFSRRVLELLACGTPVISTYNLGIERLLGRECVPLVRTEREAEKWMDDLIQNPELGERMALLGARKVFSEHTCEARLRAIMERLGLCLERPRHRVSVVTWTNRPARLESIIANYERQAWPDKELILALPADGSCLPGVQARLASVAGASAFRLPESKQSDTRWDLAACLDHAGDRCQGDYVARFDDDHDYAEHYLTDLMHAFAYTDADIVGKHSYYSGIEGEDRRVLHFPGHEHRFAESLCPSSIVAKRRVFEAVQHVEPGAGGETRFLEACVKQGFKLYSADRFNYVARRRARGAEQSGILDSRPA
ncbi:MAG: glycosyltransferase [Phycisphaerae bacterium]|nr:glycosyltransferase [Phycisphaerae bacterium]